jgi:hypothetical protein
LCRSKLGFSPELLAVDGAGQHLRSSSYATYEAATGDDGHTTILDLVSPHFSHVYV